MKRYKRGSFNGNTPTNSSEASDFRAKVFDDMCEIDTYQDNEFTVRVVTDPRLVTNQPNINSAYTYEGRRMIDSSAAMVTLKFRGQLIAPDLLEPHLLLPEACDLTSISGGDIGKAVNYSTFYIDCISAAAYDGEVPQIGDLVKVTLRTGDVGPVDCQTCYFEGIEFLSTPESNAVRRSATTEKDCNTLKAAFAAGAISAGMLPPGGSAKVHADIATTLSEGEEVPADTMIQSETSKTDQARLTLLVAAQNAFWKGDIKAEKRTEHAAAQPPTGTGTAAREYKYINMYWVATAINIGKAPNEVEGWIKNNIYIPGTQSQKVQHWSAVYVSFVIIFGLFGGAEKSKSKFEGSTYHHGYLLGSKKKNWQVYRLMGTSGKIKAQVGDILITPYNGGQRDVPNTHGDVVYKISGNTAFLTGGNLGNSVMTRSVKIDNEGFYKNDKNSLNAGGYPYYVVMKYNSKATPYSPAAIASATPPNSSEG